MFKVGEYYKGDDGNTYKVINVVPDRFYEAGFVVKTRLFCPEILNSIGIHGYYSFPKYKVKKNGAEHNGQFRLTNDIDTLAKHMWA